MSAPVVMYREFMQVNRQIKQALTDWQGQMVNGQWFRNTHQDARYDADVLARLRSFHQELKAVLVRDEVLAAAYLPGFERCIAMVDRGLVEEYLFHADSSYHSLLWKVHQELARRLGWEYREEE
ncbi:MAG: hypothetical protein HYX97_07380 [Chloroflexi bacterium]|nr:hypothetical protein [Chloroflexota bacterium]